MVQISLNSTDFNVTFDEDVVLVIATVLTLLSPCHGIELALYF